MANPDVTMPKTLFELRQERETRYLEKSIGDKRLKIDRIREDKALDKYLKSMEL